VAIVGAQDEKRGTLPGPASAGAIVKIEASNGITTF